MADYLTDKIASRFGITVAGGAVIAVPGQKQAARRATVKGVNKALSALGFSPDDLEFVRGSGYFYLSGDIGPSLYESGLYGTTPRVSDLSVEDWVSAILRQVSQDANFDSLAEAQQAKVKRALSRRADGDPIYSATPPQSRESKR